MINVPTVEEIAKQLKGRKGGLRPSKPTKANGLIKYIWRMARFHAGHDTTMPVMCEFDLMDYYEAETGKKWRDDREGFKAFEKSLDPVVDAVLVALGENPFKGAARWGKALGYL